MAALHNVIDQWSRPKFYWTSLIMLIACSVVTILWHWLALMFIPVSIFMLIGLRDIQQKTNTVRKNFPVLGNIRYLMESIRPEIRQYFIESDSEENPFSREKRSVVYQRAKKELDTLPFGTRQRAGDIGYEWLAHSLSPCHVSADSLRVNIGGKNSTQTYSASMLNISAMSFGALSSNAIMALNRGAKIGGFYHNTGEGGVSPYHLESGGDLVWQIGTGYFGCRRENGHFDAEKFEQQAKHPNIKMIELKLSQGAKPAHGGILPGVKVTKEIAQIRAVPEGETVFSPPKHKEFGTPIGLLEFIQHLRELSGDKPVGFKLCIGELREFYCICKAMLETGIYPDFITIDGAEGGTGAAPLEFSNSVGMPADDGLNFVHQTLIGVGLRDQVHLIAAGKITTGYHLLKKLVLGADICNSARAMMFSIGCIQALRCNSDMCPTGVATHRRHLVDGLDVESKSQRVANFHQATIESLAELVGASGFTSPDQIQASQIFKRVSTGEIKALSEIYPSLQPNQLLDGNIPPDRIYDWDLAKANSF